MKCPRSWRTALGALLVPPLLWTGVVAVVPTECARKSIAERLSRSSGRMVELGRVHLSLLGGVTLDDLRIGAPGSSRDPWLRVEHATLDVSLMQLLLGRVDPKSIDIHGVTLRVLRRANGRLELADLVRPEPDATASDDAELDPAHEPTGLEIQVQGATVHVIDEPTGTHLEFANVAGQVTCDGPRARVRELHGTLNGGPFQFAAQLDRSGHSPSFEGQFTVTGASLARGMMALGYLVPVVAGGPSGFEGSLNLDLYLRGRCESRETLRRTVVGHGNVRFDPVRLDGSQLLAALSPIVDAPLQGVIGAARAALTVGNGRVSTENLAVAVNGVPVSLEGWTDFDGRVDYRLRSDRIGEKLPPRARQLLSDLAGGLDTLPDVRVRGTIDALEITGLERLANSRKPTPGRRHDSRPQDLRDIGRLLRGHLRR